MIKKKPARPAEALTKARPADGCPDTGGKAPTAAPRRKFRLGLAGRVALIGCAAAIAATLAQWVATPILAGNEVRFQRSNAAQAGARSLASVSAIHIHNGDTSELGVIAESAAVALPGGQAALFDGDWRRISSAGETAPTGALLERLLKQPGLVVHGGARVFASEPMMIDGEQAGVAVYSFAPRPVSEIWFGILWRCALVLTLALAVIAPFLLPLARRALSPVAALEARIRARAPNDRSRLSDDVDDPVLKPLIAAIDEVHERSEAATRRALALAFSDPVTRLPNRLRLMSRLEALVDRSGKGAHFGIIDLNGFRKINMAYGPRAADGVLAEVARRLSACAAAQISSRSPADPGADKLALGRIGADQFGVIATGAREGFEAFLAAVEIAMVEPIIVEGQQVAVTFAAGAAEAPRDAETAADLLKLTEVALKEAKHATQTRRVFFDNRLLEKERQQAKLETEMREGLERGEFVAVFQPKIKLATGELVGAEALARWRRPDGAIVSPGVFVPLAEEIGLISQLGHSVLRDACFAAAEWNKRGVAQRVAVNVSPHQFSDPDFVDQVWRALDDSGLAPSLLELEITESAAVSEPERVARVMWPLRNRGVRLAIDDFGTGHSNFTSITRLPFDVLKIDQQFIRALSTDPNAPTIVEMILAMAEALGQETVAEGVETAEQADFLLRRNCSTGQGYHFSPPLPAHEFDAFVRSWRPRPLAAAA